MYHSRCNALSLSHATQFVLGQRHPAWPVLSNHGQQASLPLARVADGGVIDGMCLPTPRLLVAPLVLPLLPISSSPT